MPNDKWMSEQVRSAFISYFKKNGHSPQPSSRLIPENDPTILFTNAGMNQFKNLFLGLEKRDYTRAVTSQKCLRAGGKHNDLDNVGFTARHHTFFEMLGNFSFGDYFKKDAIHFAWEFITKDLGLPKDKLYVTVFETDEEAADIWHKQEGVAKDRIYRFGEKDNFWRMGDVGPCGPCSEIFIDLGPDVPGNPKDNVMGGSGDRFMEFWNLVFMQYNESAQGLTPLPKPSVDTGMGLERLTMILQGKINNYDTDIFQDLIQAAAKLSGKEYLSSLNGLKGSELKTFEETNVAFRVMADHARATAFLIADGVLPSNEGRGYVLRRIMRRALRYGRKLADTQSLMPTVVEAVIKKMGDVYPELRSQQSRILQSVKDEEQRFLTTLDQGTRIFTDSMEKLGAQKTVPGELVFKLYDTYGFPMDLTQVMAIEQGLQIDEPGFHKHMNAAKEKAKASWKGKTFTGDTAHLSTLSQELAKQSKGTEFTGYKTTTENEAQLLQASNGKAAVTSLKAGETGVVAFNKTSFYAESGGQVGDTGVIRTGTGQAEVLDTSKEGDIFWHHVRVDDGEISVGQTVQLEVQDSKRRQTAANHSATHLMHAALKKVLGTHVGQAGSLVEPDRLRFDFTHNKPLSPDEIKQVEDLVNEEISASREVKAEVLPYKKAIESGAVAMFGEKYGDEVRVLRMGDFSMELCGGTHVANTAFIRLFKIVSESGVSAGVRRIEALTGDRATQFLMQSTREDWRVRSEIGAAQSWTQFLESQDTSPVLDWIDKSRNEFKSLQKQIQDLKGSSIDADTLIQAAKPFSKNGKEGRLVVADVSVDDRKVLSELSDKLRDKVQSGLVVVIGQGDKTHPVLVSVTKNLQGELNAGEILKEVTGIMGGKGGGRPDFAQGAAPDRSKIAEAFQKASSLVGLN